jgi:hypothetical protein
MPGSCRTNDSAMVQRNDTNRILTVDTPPLQTLRVPPPATKSASGSPAVLTPALRLLSWITALVLASCTASPSADAEHLLHELRRIDLPGVTGRIDHMALDAATGRLYVAALGSDSVEIVDIRTGAAVGKVTGLREPQGVLVVPAQQRLLVTNGEADHLSVFDTSTLQLLTRIPVPEDSDNVRYEEAAGRAWVGCGSGSGSRLVAIDVATSKVVKQIVLPTHPESFQLERNGKRIFVNVPWARKVVAVDRETGETVAAWPLPALANFPVALDEKDARLFVGTRMPARLVVLDTTNGRIISELPTVGDADDIFHDEQAHRVYVAGGEGYVEVFAQRSPDRYEAVEKFATRKGARTALFMPDQRQLLVALPRRGQTPAQILILSVGGDRPND